MRRLCHSQKFHFGSRFFSPVAPGPESISTEQNTRSETLMVFKVCSSEHQELPTKCPGATSYLNSTLVARLLPHLDMRISGKSQSEKCSVTLKQNLLILI